MAAAQPDWRILVLAVLYSIGAHGIMTLNDFKSVEGDQRMGIGSLPVRLGIDNAVRFACVVMGVPQIVVVVMLAAWGRLIHALVVLLLLGAQFLLMVRLLENPANAPLVQRHRHQPVCHRHAGRGLRPARHLPGGP